MLLMKSGYVRFDGVGINIALYWHKSVVIVMVAVVIGIEDALVI